VVGGVTMFYTVVQLTFTTFDRHQLSTLATDQMTTVCVDASFGNVRCAVGVDVAADDNIDWRALDDNGHRSVTQWTHGHLRVACMRL